jgi:hypothetical protein
MPTIDSLAVKLQAKTQEASMTTADAFARINASLVAVAGMVKLPALDTSASVNTVTTGPSVALPSDYQHGMYAAKAAGDTVPLTVKHNKTALITDYQNYPAETGDARHVAAVPPNLIYHPIPSAATAITLYYYKKPATKTTTQEITEIPEHLSHIILHHAAWQYFDDLEDGIEGAKVNTDAQISTFSMLLAQLETWISQQGTRAHRPPPVVAVNW